MDAGRAVVRNIVETVSGAIARVGQIAFLIDHLITARHFAVEEYGGTLADDTTVVRAVVTVVCARNKIVDPGMAAGSRTVASIVRTLVAVIDAGGAHGFRIRRAQPVSIADVRMVAD